MTIEKVKLAQYNTFVYSHNICKWDMTYNYLIWIVSKYLMKIFNFVSENASTIIKQANY